LNSLTIHQFEAEKNRKALLFTGIVCALILIFAFVYTWKIHKPEVPAVQDLIEINLGNEQEGLGDVQPMVKGEKAPDEQSVSSPQSGMKANESPSQHINADETGDENAAPVVKSEKPVKDARDVNKNTATKSTKNVNPSPVVNPTPAPPQPKNVYKGGTGTGGNNADQDNDYRNQGNKNGNGDAGSPNGKPDSYGNSPGGRSGVSVSKGFVGRSPVHFPNMKGDFNENAKVYVDIKVNSSGAVTSASIAKGTTTANSNLRSIALQKAKELKFPSSSRDIETGTILFVFKLTN